MTPTVFAIAVATLLTLAVSGTSQAAPIAPPSGVIAGDAGAVTPVYWYRHPYYRYGYRHRHCWRGYYGRVHCAW